MTGYRTYNVEYTIEVFDIENLIPSAFRISKQYWRMMLCQNNEIVIEIIIVLLKFSCYC